MTTNPTELTVTNWLAIRARVAEQLKTEGSQQRPDTRERIAERLMEHGFIDVTAVLDTIEAERKAEADAATFAGTGEKS